jgi:hypothetical protein
MVIMTLLTAYACSFRDFVAGKKIQRKSVADVIKENYRDTVKDLKDMNDETNKKTK